MPVDFGPFGFKAGLGNRFSCRPGIANSAFLQWLLIFLLANNRWLLLGKLAMNLQYSQPAATLKSRPACLSSQIVFIIPQALNAEPMHRALNCKPEPLVARGDRVVRERKP